MSESTSTTSSAESAATPKSRRRRQRPGRRTLWVGVGLVAGAVLLFLPNLLVLLFPGQLLGLISKQLDGRLSATSLSAGWFQPVIVAQPRAEDTDGQLVFAAAQLKTEKTLLNLILAPRELGTLHIARPTLHVTTWEGGSNVEQLLAPLLAQPPSDQPLEVAWRIQQGEVQLSTPAAPEIVTFQTAELTGRLTKLDHIHVLLDGLIDVTAGQQRGSLEVKSAARDEAPATDAAAVDVLCRADTLPLACLDPVLVRLATGVRVTGQFSGETHLIWQAAEHQGRLDSLDCEVSGLHLVTAAGSAARGIELNKLAIQGAAQWTETQLDIDRLTVTSDVGRIRLHTEAPLAPEANLLAAARQVLARSRVDVEAEIDLAALSTAAPELMRLRDDVRISSGNVQARLASEPQAGQARWTATLTSSALRGVRGGQPFVWDDPLNAELAAQWTGERLIFEQLVCRSDFLVASLEGTPAQGAVNAEANLDRLAQRLAQLIHLDGVQLAGTVQSRTEWQHRAPQLTLDGHVTLDEFVLALPGRPTWQEPRLALNYSLQTALGEDRGLAAIQAASVELTAPAERAVLQLISPVSAPVLEATWPLTLQVSSRLDKWLPRLSPLVAIDQLAVDGLLEINGRVDITPEAVALDSLNADVEELVVVRENLRISEPRAVAKLAGRWMRPSGTWITQELKLQTSAVALSSPDLRVQTGARPELAGRILYTGDLQRMQSWFGAALPATVQIHGELVGQADLSSTDEGLMQVEGQLDIDQFQVAGLRVASEAPARGQPASAASNWKPLWREPKIVLRGRGQWHPDRRTLVLDDLAATGQAVRISGQGNFSDLSGKAMVDIAGELRYDLEQLTPKLRKLTFSQLALAGQQREPFSLQGPLLRPVLTTGVSTAAGPPTLVPSELTGQGALSWQGADILGIVIGKGQMRGELREARVQFTPVEIPVSGGRLQAAPWIDLTQSPARLVHPPGKILADVQLSPELCRSWLQFVAPLVANATSAEGQFGLELDRLSLPLGAAQQADVAGSLTIQQARIGPGPVSQTLLTAVQQVLAVVDRRLPLSSDRQWVTLPAQVVAFEVDNGRVIHRNFLMQVGDVQITTKGWVALDQSMSLTVEIPIRDEWVQRNRLLASLRGKSLTIPIEGTLVQPRLDDRVLKDLSRQVLGNAAGGLLRGLLERQLQPNPE